MKERRAEEAADEAPEPEPQRPAVLVPGAGALRVSGSDDVAAAG
jgi:hypothetical protein